MTVTTGGRGKISAPSLECCLLTLIPTSIATSSAMSMLRGSNSDPTFSPTLTRISCTVAIDSPVRLASSTVVMPSNISIVFSCKKLLLLFNFGI
uniref:Uncharacterized protein n=1 Tax=Rhizophora mucronata TaxID=61149 RepID=A0A2P2K0P9_RHIMU